MRISMNSTQQGKKNIVFDDMIADIMSNQNFQAVVKEFFFRIHESIFF